jgi:hypothetical protein
VCAMEPCVPYPPVSATGTVGSSLGVDVCLQPRLLDARAWLGHHGRRGSTALVTPHHPNTGHGATVPATHTPGGAAASPASRCHGRDDQVPRISFMLSDKAQCGKAVTVSFAWEGQRNPA